MSEVRKVSAIHPAMRLRSSSGFTLLELLIVISIIGILVGLMLPAIGWVKMKARIKQAETEVKSLAMACRAYHTEYGYWPIPGDDKNANGAWSNDNYVVVSALVGSGNPHRISFVESTHTNTAWADPFKSNLPYRISIDVTSNSVTVSCSGPDCDPGGNDNITVNN